MFFLNNVQRKRVGFVCLVALLLASVCDSSARQGRTVQLTDEEQQWLHTHPVIRVANETDWPPFDFNESGRAKGLTIDYITLLAQKVGLNVEFVYGYSWGELVEQFQQRKIDVMPAFYINEQRKAFTLYTKPYYRGKLGIFTHREDTSWSYSLLHTRVGMERSHGSIAMVKQKVPGVEIIEVDKKVDLVRQLATKQLDAIIGNPFVFYYIAREMQIETIQLTDFISMTEEEQQKTSLHVGVRSDWPLLHSILQKAMEQVSAEEMATIENEWADITIVNPVNWARVAQLLAALGCILLFLLWHNRKLKSTVALKTKQLKKLNENLESTVVQRTKKLTEVNAALNKSLDELQTLRGILPICSFCKNIRNDEGYYEQIEAYIEKHSEVDFSHTVCPDCLKKHYPKEYDEIAPYIT